MILDLKKFLKKYNIRITGVIHIGAHHGEEYEYYKELGVTDQLFFEPIPECFKVLEESVGDRAINKALGNRTGKAVMNIASNNGVSSSILEPCLHKKQYPYISFKKTIQVDMVRLDDIDTFGYNFISIDVQGYELEVFKGAIETLQDIDYILTEVNRRELFKGCVQIGELDRFLEGQGFARVEVSWAGKTWGDALYMKWI